MSAAPLVVVGGSLAGLRAVEGARAAGYRGRIVLVGQESHLPYDRPPLSKAFLESDAAHPPFRDLRSLRDELDVDPMLGVAATGLDPEARELLTASRRIPYGSLVIATGAAARRLPGADGLAGVHTLRTLDDAIAVRRVLDSRPRRVVVLGAGFIGSEIASAARSRGLEVSVIELAPTPLVGAVGEEAGTVLAGLHRQNGVDLRLGVGVDHVIGDRGVEAVRLSDGSELETELLIVGAGAAPATAWLEASGIGLDERDRGVIADETLRTGLPGVWAAGDVVHWPNAALGRRMRLEHWTSAAEQGAVAGRNAVASEPIPYATVPYFWSDWYGHRIQFVGAQGADGVLVVSDLDRDGRHLALYRDGERLVGALSVDLPSKIMKYRRMIAAGAGWNEALGFARAA